jgi:hypothetical protein
MGERNYELNVRWGISPDGRSYRGQIALVREDGTLGTVRVDIDRERVLERIHALRGYLARTAPVGADLSPEGEERLIKYEAQRLLAGQLRAKFQRAKLNQLVAALLRDPWTVQTADQAYRALDLADNGDKFMLGVLSRISQQARKDARAAAALRKLQLIREARRRGQPLPSQALRRGPALPALPARPVWNDGMASLPALPPAPEDLPAGPIEDDSPDVAELEQEVDGGALPEFEHYLVVGRKAGKRVRRRVSSRRALDLMRRAGVRRPSPQMTPGAPPAYQAPPSQAPGAAPPYSYQAQPEGTFNPNTDPGGDISLDEIAQFEQTQGSDPDELTGPDGYPSADA